MKYCGTHAWLSGGPQAFLRSPANVTGAWCGMQEAHRALHAPVLDHPAAKAALGPGHAAASSRRALPLQGCKHAGAHAKVVDGVGGNAGPGG